MRVSLGLIPSLLLWMSTTVHAAVVDKFQCRMKFDPSLSSSIETRTIDTTVELYIARKLVDGSLKSLTLTEGSAAVSTNSGLERARTARSFRDVRMQTAFRLVYLHAVRRNQAGQAVRAASHVCLSHTFLAGGSGMSNDCRPVCDEPFSPRCQWTEVAVKNGIPAFDPKLLKPITQTLATGALELSCRFDGTFE